VTANLASAINPTSPQPVSTDAPVAAPETKLSVVPAKASDLQSREDAQPAADKVTLSEQARQSVSETEKEKKAAAKALKSDANTASGSIAKTEFVYDAKGELIVKYMNTTNKLVYQIPSELMLKLKESEAKSTASVNTNA
jgi:uncharacterized FlaG/YvyC family protein